MPYILHYPKSVANLTSAQRDFLQGFQSDNYAADAIPVYVRVGDGSAWVCDVACPFARRGEFKAAPDGLFLSGAAVFVLVKQGICVIPDERGAGCFKATIQGWSCLAEGGQPLQTALREGTEEIVAFTVKGRVELVPAGMPARSAVRSLNVQLSSVCTLGEFTFLRVNENVSDRVIEFVYTWDLRGVDDAITFGYDDTFFRGGHMGVNVHVLGTDGQLVGVFSGQQGFVAVANLAKHSVVQNSWELLSAL